MSDFITFLSKHFESILSHRHRGWFAAVIVVCFALGGALIYDHYRESPPTLTTLYVICLSALLGLCLWIWSMHLPKARRGTIGFGVAFVCDTDSQAQKIRTNFVAKMRSLVATGMSTTEPILPFCRVGSRLIWRTHQAVSVLDWHTSTHREATAIFSSGDERDCDKTRPQSMSSTFMALCGTKN